MKHSLLSKFLRKIFNVSPAEDELPIAPDVSPKWETPIPDNAYRSADIRLPTPIPALPQLKKLHSGNRKSCVACGAEVVKTGDYYPSLIVRPGVMPGQVCTDAKCPEKRNHLHQACGVCNFSWIVGFVEDTVE